MENFKDIVTIATYGIESFGVLVVIIGSSIATFHFLSSPKDWPKEETYQQYRRSVGRSIILGLEFLIAGDVIRTVIVTHSLSSVAVLALLVLIRTFLSLTLAMEIEGRMPWQKS